MIAFASAIAAVAGAYQARVQEGDSRANALREMDRWEEEHLRPRMSTEKWEAHVAERTRLRERAEDILRQERQHQELVAAEREKAAAIREASRHRPSDLLLGFVAGELLGR